MVAIWFFPLLVSMMASKTEKPPRPCDIRYFQKVKFVLTKDANFVTVSGQQPSLEALNAEIDKALNGSLNKNISKVKLFHTRLYNYAIISYLTDEYKFKIKWKALYKNEPTTQVRFAVPGHGPAYYLQEDPHGFHVTRLSEHVCDPSKALYYPDLRIFKFGSEDQLQFGLNLYYDYIHKYENMTSEPVLLPYSNPPNYLTNLERCPTKPKTNDEEVLILPSSGSDLYRDPKKINATKGTYFLNQVIDLQHRYRLHVELLEDEFGDPFFYHILTYMEHPTEVFSDDFLLSKKCYIRQFKKESAEIPRMLVVPLEYATEYVPLPRPSEVDSIPILEPTTATAEPTKTIVAGTKILGKKASNEECNYVIATVIMVLIALVVE